MQVYVVEAEHYSVPGRILRIYRDEQAALDYAKELVVGMLSDYKCAHPESDAPDDAEDWPEVVAWLQDVYGAAHVYVEISDHYVWV